MLPAHQAPRLPPRPVDRAELIRRARAHLERYGYARIELFFIVAFSGAAGFLVSYALLGAGVSSMPLRYGVAGAAAYVAFLFLIWVWIAWKSRLQAELDSTDVIDLLDLTPRRFGGGTGHGLFDGGRSGGGGASASWGEARPPSAKSGSSWFDWDGDAAWILVFLAVLLVALATIGYVVYIAPALLAEVLVDSVIVAAVSKRVTGLERRDWTATVLRRTWLAALLMIASLVIGGWALQTITPDARSIGPALERMLD